MQTTSSQINESNEPKTEARSAITEMADESVDSGPTPDAIEIALPDAATTVDDPIRIPNAYRDLVGPIPPPRLSSAELHELFEKEPRDEAWAYAMESGINDHIANFGTGEGTVVEYVECRSQHCEIAGFADKGHMGSIGRVYGDMTRSGWWQADGGTHHIGGHVDGLDRFVIITSRYARE